MKLIVTLSLLFFSFSVFAQNKKIQFEIASRINVSTCSDKFRTTQSADNVLRVTYRSSKKWDNPFYSLAGIATKSLTKNISAGLSTGLYLFDKETHDLGIKRTFVALPIQTVFDYHTKLNDKQAIGTRISPGILLYKIDDTFIKVNNAFVVDGEIYYKISPRSKFQIGWNQIVENGNMNFFVTNTNSEIKKDFSLNRSAVYLGYTFVIK